MTQFYAVFAALTLATPALADAPAPIRVTFAAPVAQSGAVQGLATQWTCAGATCTGPELNARYGDARACREAARAVGTVTAYESARGALGADDLAKCNRAAKRS